MIRCTLFVWSSTVRIPVTPCHLKHTWPSSSLLFEQVIQIYEKFQLRRKYSARKNFLPPVSGMECATEEETVANGDIKEENWEEHKDPVCGYETFDAYLQDAFDTVQAGIKSANSLPQGDNYNYYTCFTSFNTVKQREIKRILDLMQHICGSIGVHTRLTHSDIDERFEVLLEANDILLDRANVCMDEESGITGNLNPDSEKPGKTKDTSGSWNRTNFSVTEKDDKNNKFVQLPGKSLDKPQTQFKDKVDNSSTPWCPKIKDKPNAITPLHLYLVEGTDDQQYNHPYQVELDKFNPPESQLIKRTPVKYKSLDETPLIVIDKPADVKKLMDDLRNQKEIAIDLEHHSHRSFQGLTCLMQIATPNTDYIIDTITLRDDLQVLNEVFTDPKILKVLHGAGSDIIWLQRDLGLYIVNMFDTYFAAMQLSMPFLSLAYLLQLYCNVQPNKHLQLADWRIRPLSNQLLTYAREDVHYLLHIKDHLINQLIDTANGQSNIVNSVYNMSTDLCKRTYIKPLFTDKNYMHLYRQSKKIFNNKQLYALQELYKWRDMTARENDDSIGYVLPNHMLLCISETLPREMQGILACCNPIPPLVRQNLLVLHKVILKAREQPLIKPQLTDDLRQRLAQRNHASSSDALSYCPHDIPSGSEPRSDLPCLLDEKQTQDTSGEEQIEHTVTVFDSPVTSENEAPSDSEDKGKKRKKNKWFSFISPFERYKRVLPMVAEQEARDREKQKKQEEKRQLAMKKEEEDTKDRIERIHEHFQEVAQSAESQEPPSPEKKVKKEKWWKAPLGKWKGGKRKMHTSAYKKEEIDTANNLTSPTPKLNKKILTGVKRKMKNDEPVLLNVNTGSTSSEIKPLRKRHKGEKKANEMDLDAKGMLPAKNFDYKEVDFSSFQGGSTNAPNQAQFKQTTRKKRRQGKKKKVKINI